MISLLVWLVYLVLTVQKQWFNWTLPPPTIAKFAHLQLLIQKEFEARDCFIQQDMDCTWYESNVEQFSHTWGVGIHVWPCAREGVVGDRVGLHGACPTHHQPSKLVTMCYIMCVNQLEHVGHVPPWWGTLLKSLVDTPFLGSCKLTKSAPCWGLYSILMSDRLNHVNIPWFTWLFDLSTWS